MAADPQSLLAQLKTHVDNGDVDSGLSTLSKIKIALLDAPDTKMNMEALELGVLLHVAAGDLDGFARNYAQLQPLLLSGQEDTQRTCLLLGLNLMCLLVENRLSEFHAEMELLTSEQASNAYISFPITLERQLMVGSYDEVLKAHLHIPDKSYAFFMDNLTLTVKDSIADCIEVSYQKMKLKDAMTMMKFATQDELLEYVKEARDDWIVVDGEFLEFQPPPTKRQASDIPSKTLISQSLAYATELERII
jgi:26S proteasome regulatory subunit N12